MLSSSSRDWKARAGGKESPLTESEEPEEELEELWEGDPGEEELLSESNSTRGGGG